MPDNDDHLREHEIGYGRPPKHTQFRKGVSGNPTGRPKGAKNLASIVREVLSEKVVIVENRQRRTVTKLKAVVKQLANKSASGDLHAMRQLIPYAVAAEIENSAAGNKSDVSEADKKVMARLVERMQKSLKGDKQ